MTQLDPIQDEPFPMQQGGGSFLACMGTALIFGAFSPRYVFIALGCGMAIGLLAIVSVRISWWQAGGARPSALQVWMLIAAIALEFVLFATVFPHVPDDMRLRWVVALAIVAVHFLPMAWTYGPPIVLLALSGMVWLAAAFWLPAIPLGVVIGIDGALKLFFGLVMMTQNFARPPLWPLKGPAA